MNFNEIALKRRSCRSYDKSRDVEPCKIEAIMQSARLAPSACNGQPYHFTVCTKDTAARVAKCVMGMGMNRFAENAPVMIVISEEQYVKTAAFGAKLKKNDYRSMDIGIAAAYITAEATAIGLGTCIIGWFDDEKIREICGIDNPVRLVITLGYSTDDESIIREKKRKPYDELISMK